MAKPLSVDSLWKERIVQSLDGLEYGAVHIVVHDGRIVQIERTERRRFEGEAANKPAAGAVNDVQERSAQ